MPSTKRNVPINEELLNKALQNRNMSKYRLFKILEDMQDDHGNALITARSAQRAIKRGTISANVRDAISRLLNVTPEYLEGKWIVKGDTDPGHYPYRLHNTSGINEDEAFRQLFDSILTDYGFTAEELTHNEYLAIFLQTTKVLYSFCKNALCNREDQESLEKWENALNAAMLNAETELAQERRSRGKKEDYRIFRGKMD